MYPTRGIIFRRCTLLSCPTRSAKIIHSFSSLSPNGFVVWFIGSWPTPIICPVSRAVVAAAVFTMENHAWCPPKHRCHRTITTKISRIPMSYIRNDTRYMIPRHSFRTYYCTHPAARAIEASYPSLRRRSFDNVFDLTAPLVIHFFSTRSANCMQRCAGKRIRVLTASQGRLKQERQVSRTQIM